MGPVDFSSVYGSPAKSFEGGQSTVAGGLALSGGGFRAMLFHLGALRRLHEVGALTTITRISSVSGGSITAARLALYWDAIVADPTDLDVFTTEVQQRLFDFAGSRIDVRAGLGGLIRPGRSIAQSVATHYARLLENAQLSALPDSVRFVFCATNLGTGSLLRFAKPYTADRRVGKRDGLELRPGPDTPPNSSSATAGSTTISVFNRSSNITRFWSVTGVGRSSTTTPSTPTGFAT